MESCERSAKEEQESLHQTGAKGNGRREEVADEESKDALVEAASEKQNQEVSATSVSKREGGHPQSQESKRRATIALPPSWSNRMMMHELI